MEIRETGCDREGCKNRNATSFHVHSHRAHNGVDTEDWDHVFDLCPSCVASLLRIVLDLTDKVMAKEIIDKFKVKTRLG